MRIRRLIACVVLMGATVFASTSDELKKLQLEVNDLKVEVFRLRQQVEDANVKAEAERVAAAEARALTRRFQADLQELMRQLQESNRILNNRLGSAPIGAPKAGGATAAPNPASEDEKAYNAAVLDYNRGNYSLAAESLGLFLKSNPQSPRKPDALFFLGLSYYNQKIFDKALQTFDQILRDHASSSQFLPAKLKRAQCLAKQGLKAAAVKAFKEITDGFRGSPEARTAQQELADLGF